VCSHLDIPEAFSSLRLTEDLGEPSLIKPEDLLCVPFKVRHNIRVVEMVRYPIPYWAAPGVKRELFLPEFMNDLVAFKL